MGHHDALHNFFQSFHGVSLLPFACYFDLNENIVNPGYHSAIRYNFTAWSTKSKQYDGANGQIKKKVLCERINAGQRSHILRSIL